MRLDLSDTDIDLGTSVRLWFISVLNATSHDYLPWTLLDEA